MNKEKSTVEWGTGVEWSEWAAVRSDEFEGVTADLEHVVHEGE